MHNIKQIYSALVCVFVCIKSGYYMFTKYVVYRSTVEDTKKVTLCSVLLTRYIHDCMVSCYALIHGVQTLGNGTGVNVH